jgi:ATP-dependent helicase/nuclease subunit B
MTEQLGFDFDTPPTEADRSDAPEPRASPARGETDTPPPGPCRLVESLAAAARAHPWDRKLLLARTRGQARELLRQLALHEGAWLGFEVGTVLPLAVELAGPSLAGEGREVLDEFDRQALLDGAIDRVLLGAGRGPLSELAEGVGFRAALSSSVLSLRIAGVTADRVQAARFEDGGKQRVLAAIEARYEALLQDGGATDEAGVLARAAELLEGAPPDSIGELLGGRSVFLLPGLGLRGLPGRIVRALIAGGAAVLETDPVRGLERPPAFVWAEGPVGSPLSDLHAPGELAEPGAGGVEVFSAASIGDELREVLRRAADAGFSWDQVEIVAADASVYGSAMHTLSRLLDVPVSFAAGLPVQRTRPGRAVTAFFRWLDSGFHAEVIRSLLEAGDLTPPRPWDRILPSRLARRFRDLRIGWGRARYLDRIDQRLSSVEQMSCGRHETEEGLEKRKERTRLELRAIKAIVEPVLRRTPTVPGRLDTAPEKVSPAQLARGLRAFLDRVPVTDAVDRTAAERLMRRLDRVRETLDRRTDYRAAAATLLGHLDFRVPAPRAEGRAPWSSAGGHLYLSDFEHGGYSGRAATFLVGLDAGRVPGQGNQDPLLLDAERYALGDQLPRSRDRVAERSFSLAALLARLRGRVCLSYCAWDPSEARAAPPSTEILQAHRIASGQASAGFKALHRHLGTAVGVVPRRHHLDARDVWLSALASHGRLLAGTPTVREAFPRLDAGLRARAALPGPVATPFHGRVTPRPDALDPRRNPERVVSASALETLGRCPRRYLYRYVLGLRPPDDPELDPDRWLDPLQKGALLHTVYERTLAAARREGVGPAELAHVAQRILSEEAKRALVEVPAPSEAVRLKELDDLELDIRAFVEAVTPWLDDWVALELKFGLAGTDPVALPVKGGTINVRGAIDRVDRTPEGLVVIDYKTGSTARYSTKSGTYDGGRRLQHLVYTRVAALLLAEPVARMEYSFPTHANLGESLAYPPDRLRTGERLVGTMLDGVARGWFLPTDAATDCTYCDFARLCGVHPADRENPSPLATWSDAHRDELEELSALRRVRRWDEEGEGLWPAT